MYAPYGDSVPSSTTPMSLSFSMVISIGHRASQLRQYDLALRRKAYKKSSFSGVFWLRVCVIDRALRQQSCDQAWAVSRGALHLKGGSKLWEIALMRRGHA
jgi:hypothetical protein